MVDDHIQYYHHSTVVGIVNQIAQILTSAEARIDFEKVLDGIAVVGLQVRSLLEGWIQPEAGNSEALQVIQLAADALKCAAIEAQTSLHSGFLVGGAVLLGVLLVDLFLEAHERAPNEIILDLDATDDPVHGEQEPRPGSLGRRM